MARSPFACASHVSAAILCASLVACTAKAPPPADPVVAVEITAARVQPISQMVVADGALFPIRQASLSPKVTAPVRTFYVNRGDKVRQGQLLAVLENRDLAAALVSAEGSYDQAKANYATTTSSSLPEELQKSKLDLQTAKAGVDAQQKLYESEKNLFAQGAIARKQLDATEVALTTARGLYEQAQKREQNLQASGAAHQRQAAKGQLESSHGQYLAATAQLQYTEMRSPINGAVADRAVYPGDIAPAGTPLFIVMDTTKVVARLHVPQPLAVQLKLGDQGFIQEPGLDQKIPCTVTVLSPALDPSSTTVEVWVEAVNVQNHLQPGTTVQVSLTARTVPDALVVPASSLLSESSGTASVMVVRADSRAYSQPVRIGIRQHQLVQILSGLKPGDVVITSGAYGLPDKTQVKVTPTNSSGSEPSGS